MKAVILARVSSREQENGMSIDAQLDNMNKYVQRTGLHLLKIFQITESSTRGDRKKFVEMLGFVKSQKEKIVIVADTIDRIQRSFKESIELDELRKHDQIELHFIRENLVLSQESSSADLMRWDFGVMMAKSYVGNLRDNVKRSMTYNISQGMWQHRAPLGYLNKRNDNNKAIIIPDPDRAYKVKKLFELYSTGLHTLGSMIQVCKEIHLTGVQSDRFLTKSSIHAILKNPFYYGVMCVKGKLYPHTYEPLIDKPMFDKCQAILNGKSTNKQKYSEKPFIFRGLIKCADCGCTISSDKKVKSSGKSYTYLSCSHYKGNCTQKAVNESVIIEQIRNEVFDNLSIPDNVLKEIRNCLRDSLKAESEYVQSTLTGLQANYTHNIEKKSRLLDLLLDNSITKDEYDKKLNEIEESNYNIQKQIEAHASADKSFGITLESLMILSSHAGQLFESSEVSQKRELINLLLSNCTLKDGKLQYSLRKPFDALVNLTNRSNWLGQLDSNQRHTD